MAALGDSRTGISCLKSFMFLPYIKYGISELMELRHVVDVVPILRCMLVMYGFGIITIDRVKESFQPIIGNGRLENDVSVRDKPNRERTYTRKRRSMKTILCHGCKKPFTYKNDFLSTN